MPDIFANVEQLLVFNEHLLAEIRRVCETASKPIGSLFKKHAPFIKMYSFYVSNYHRAIGTLDQISKVRRALTTNMNILAALAVVVVLKIKNSASATHS